MIRGEQAAPNPGRRLTLLVLAAIVAAGAGLRAGAFLAHHRVDFDEGRYLDNAVHILEGHGLATSTVSFFYGNPPRPPRPEDISSPLYPLLLAGFFAVTGVSFEAGKLLALVMSIGAIPILFLLGWRIFGKAAGLVAAGLLALQPDQAIVGSWVMTESFYGMLVLLTLLAAAPLASEGRWSAWRSVGVGLLLGLLYLARQNGAVVAAGVALFLLLAPAARRAGGMARRAGLAVLMAAVCFLVCLPWFVRNTERFGSPAFSRLKNVAWAEHARSLYTPSKEDPSVRTYLRDHGASGLARNIGTRIRRVGRALIFAEAGPFRWAAFLGLLAPFAATLRSRSIFLLAPALLTGGLLLGVATWSGAIPRYLLPVRPLLYLCGAAVLLHIARHAAERMAPLRHARAWGAGVVVAAVAWAAATSGNVYAAYIAQDQSTRHEAALDAAEWLARETSPGEVILEGGFLHQYAWVFRRGVVWIPYGPLASAFDVAARYGATYLAVTAEVLRFRPHLEAYWHLESGRLEVRAEPPGLDLAYDGRGSGVMIYLIRSGAAGGEGLRGTETARE